MRHVLSSVRARTTLGATLVVAAALVVAGLAVVLLLRASLGGQADLRAEVTARNIASQLATGIRFADLDLPNGIDHPVQIVGEEGRLLAASAGLEAIEGTGSPEVRPSPSPPEPPPPDSRTVRSMSTSTLTSND